jgi:cobalamin-dependent methionine synthase I
VLLFYPLCETDPVVRRAIRLKRKTLLSVYVRRLSVQGIGGLNVCVQEKGALWFVLDAIQGESLPISLDTHDSRLREEIMQHFPVSLINSSYPTKEALVPALEAARRFGASLVVLSILRGKPEMDVSGRMRLIERAVVLSRRYGIAEEKLFVDVVVLPYAHYPARLAAALEIAAKVKASFPHLKTLGGIENLRYRGDNHPFGRWYSCLLAPLLDAAIVRDFFL